MDSVLGLYLGLSQNTSHPSAPVIHPHQPQGCDSEAIGRRTKMAGQHTQKPELCQGWNGLETRESRGARLLFQAQKDCVSWGRRRRWESEAPCLLGPRN